MTGTALTEATEFMKIYKLPVVQIPTNRPMVREDRNDQVFKTKDGKWARGRARDRRAPREGPAGPRRHDLRRGLRAASASELDASAASRTPCSTPSPSTPSARARSIAEAGRPGAVTIATNMAGRGVDIKLGGNPEHLTQLELAKLGLRPATRTTTSASPTCCPTIEARVEEDREKVLEAGGLFIVGTERHESRRIDNQLRGRSGRQGDPGESRFFLSAEDDLVRLFAGDRIYRILDRLGPVSEEGEEEPIEAKMLSKQIENAQRKVEEQNFLIRKRVLEYDDVMNQQREIVYQYRDECSRARTWATTAREQIAEVIGRAGRRVHARRLRRGVGPRRPVGPARPDLPRRLRPRGARPRGASTASELKRAAGRGRAEALRRARGGARRRAHARARALPAAPDHRPALARAPLRHGLPARGHPPPRVRPDRPARRLQERGLRRCSRT